MKGRRRVASRSRSSPSPFPRSSHPESYQPVKSPQLHTLVAAALWLPAVVARAQIPAPREFRHKELIVTGYHEPSGYGSVELKPIPVEGAPETSLTTMFRYKGRRLAAPPTEVRVVFVSTAPGGGRYAAVKTVVFAPDDA